MRAAIEWGKGCVDGAPAEGADLPLDQHAALGKYEIGTIPAAFVLPRVVLIPGGGLCEFLLILRFVVLGFSSGSTATGHGGDSAHCFDKIPPRRSEIRHGCLPLALLNDIQSTARSQCSRRGTTGASSALMIVAHGMAARFQALY